MTFGVRGGGATELSSGMQVSIRWALLWFQAGYKGIRCFGAECWSRSGKGDRL